MPALLLQWQQQQQPSTASYHAPCCLAQIPAATFQSHGAMALKGPMQLEQMLEV